MATISHNAGSIASEPETEIGNHDEPNKTIAVIPGVFALLEPLKHVVAVP